MGLPQLETCCFIFDLKTGNIILGCLNAVLSFAMVVIMIVAATTTGVEEDIDIQTLDDVEKKAGLQGLYAMCIILCLMFTAKFFFDIVFVYGVVTERAGIIKSYVIMWIVFFLLHMFVFFLHVEDFSTGTVCTELFNIGLNVYMILLVRSYYNMLNCREEV